VGIHNYKLKWVVSGVKYLTNLAPVKFPTVALFVSFRNNPLANQTPGQTFPP
jgi:hypothetical protein